MGHLSCKRVFDDQIRLLKAGYDVPLPPLEIGKHVAKLFYRNRQPFVRKQIGMQHRRVGLGRFHRIEQRLQLIIFNLDQIQRLLRRLFSLRRNRGDLLTDKPHHAVRQNRRIINAPANSQPRNILSGDYRLHARHPPSLADVDTLDAPVRDRATQDLTPQRTRQIQIRTVERLSRDL